MNARTIRLFLFAPLLLATCAAAQSVTPPTTGGAPNASQPEVTLLPMEPVKVTVGKSASFHLSFQVCEGFHINSNAPKNPDLIPTVLKLSPPGEMVTGKVAYPEGQLLTLPFLPDEKLSVYTGTFQVSGMVKTTRSLSPGTYRVRGKLEYQPCSDRQCLPPRSTPLSFDVKVVRGSSAHRANPPQSPNIHN